MAAAAGLQEIANTVDGGRGILREPRRVCETGQLGGFTLIVSLDRGATVTCQLATEAAPAAVAGAFSGRTDEIYAK